ncbi:repeat element 33 [Diadegma semiclausum ichnovirus]|nr:repeat element 33 [Diadegma semiclausum ichnovirus]
MDLPASTTGALTPPPSLTSKQIVLPLEVVFYISKFLKFDDIRSFIQSLWPNGHESDIVQSILWQLSTHRYTTWFINGKQLEIEYNFDPSRVKEERVLVNVNCLLPVFGGIVMPAVEAFTSLRNLKDFVRMHVHVNMCSNCEYASCPCHLRNVDRHDNYELFRHQLIDTCNYRHFHHYCSQHVSHWLAFVMDYCIPLQQAGESMDADGIEGYLHFLGNKVSFEGSDVLHLGDSLVLRTARPSRH